ncbi:rolling circle replication-associated protein [Clostridium septicum]|uniref:Replication-associated protein ORF2/G2P domain-containing protein n=1 Tax=Clostridium septicum TaxID=1504 RepID=A0A9N7JPB8_CLOSE|nr:hypothetical protein [Clostridium septicum]AYE35675.1 hypothetical protein CP523_15235 [Clostridium septicum]UEC19652.1 hypothetical protein LK444_09470 [Clostridium septicum]USS02287.1 hypothetical protein NH397_07705 [Clostridium septicum]WLF70870.1 hypothetical protein Q6375_07810 [Clostridium septicum]
MFYRQKVYKLIKKMNVKTKESQEVLDISMFPITMFEKKKSRKRKKRESRVVQKNLNDKNAKKYFYRKVQCNFDTSDYIWCISYDKKPKNDEEANRDFENLIRRINNYRKKKGLERTRYMAVKEGGEGTKKRIHYHIIIDGDIDRNTLESFWKKGYSNTRTLRAREDGFKDLTQYMTKEGNSKKRWKCSRGNLVEPQAMINDNRFSRKKMREMLTQHPSREEIEALYPGYTLTDYSIKYNEENGGVYMNILMRRTVKNYLDKRRKRSD